MCHDRKVVGNNFAPEVIYGDPLPEDLNFSFHNIENILDRETSNKILLTAIRTLAVTDPRAFLQFNRSSDIIRDILPQVEYRRLCLSAEQLIDIHEDYLATTGINEGQRCLEEHMRRIYSSPNFFIALERFNEENNLSLEVIGINPSRDHAIPFQFVLVNTFQGSDTTPIRIGLTASDLADPVTIEEMVDLLRSKLHAERTTNAAQYALWESEHNYDLPYGETSVMFACVPSNVSGAETDITRLIEIYREAYGADISAVCMEDRREWENTPGVRTMIQDDQIPPTSEASKQEILDNLRESLIEAIENGDKAFVFH